MSKGAIAGLVILGLVVLGAVLNAGDESEDGVVGTQDSSGFYTLVYRVDGNSNQADITIENESGDTSQYSGEPLPWEESFTVSAGDFIYVSAQRGGAPGDITCTIELDGAVVESNTSTGEFSICTASGTV